MYFSADIDLKYTRSQQFVLFLPTRPLGPEKTFNVTVACGVYEDF